MNSHTAMPSCHQETELSSPVMIFVFKITYFESVLEGAHMPRVFLWRSEDNILELVLSFHQGDSRDGVHFVRLCV